MFTFASLSTSRAVKPLHPRGELHAAFADMYRRLERFAEATARYERALELAQAEPERRFLRRRIVEMRALSS